MIIDRMKLIVTIDGNTVHPSSFRLEQYAFCLPVCTIFSGEHKLNINTGKAIVSLGDETIFTGLFECSGDIQGGQFLTFGYMTGRSVGNYRKEKAPYIFDDLLFQSRLKKGNTEIPNVEFAHAHFSGNGWTNLMDFANSLSDFTGDDYDLYMSPNGTLEISPIKKSGTIKTEFKRGKNALLITDKIVKAFPVPLAYGDFIKVNGKVKRVTGLMYRINPKNSIMEVMF